MTNNILETNEELIIRNESLRFINKCIIGFVLASSVLFAMIGTYCFDLATAKLAKRRTEIEFNEATIKILQDSLKEYRTSEPVEEYSIKSDGTISDAKTEAVFYKNLFLHQHIVIKSLRMKLQHQVHNSPLKEVVK